MGIDPDLLRAVMYVENAQGHYSGAANIAEALGIASSLFPMNINPDLWGSLSPYGNDFYEPQNNIAAAAVYASKAWQQPLHLPKWNVPEAR